MQINYLILCSKLIHQILFFMRYALIRCDVLHEDCEVSAVFAMKRPQRSECKKSDERASGGDNFRSLLSTVGRKRIGHGSGNRNADDGRPKVKKSKWNPRLGRRLRFGPTNLKKRCGKRA